MRQYFYLFGLWLFLMTGVNAKVKVLDVSYKVSFGILGELGVSHARLETDRNKYTISIDVGATGIAKALSNNRTEKHYSKGFVKNGRYHSTFYSVEVVQGNKKREKIYTIDYKKKRITKTKKYYRDGKLLSTQSEKLDFFSSNDLLTLYFNLPRLISDKNKSGKYTFQAVGAEKQGGKIEVLIPQKKHLPEYHATLGKGEFWYLTAIIYQKIFNSSKGELMLAIGKDGITQKAVLKDLIMFGDLRAERID